MNEACYCKKAKGISELTYEEVFKNNFQWQYTHASKACRDAANLTERTNLHTHVYGVKNLFVCP